MSAPRILIVDDEPTVRLLFETRLRAAGYAVSSADSAEEALAQLAPGAFDLLITDLHLKAMDGVALLAQARSIDPELALVILTGGATIDSAIAAVNHGVHAYLRKPVALCDLEDMAAAAIQRRRAQQERAALLRQVSATLLRIAEPYGPGYTPTPPDEPVFRAGPLLIDSGRRRVSLGGEPVAVSRGEFDLLLCMARRANTVMSPETLAREVLGYQCSQDEARELIKARIHRLRQKIEPDPRAPCHIVSVRGAGYMFAPGD